MNNLIVYLSNYWLVIAILAPMFWALADIINIYFVDGIYKDEIDGTIISGIFQIIPWFILLIFSGFRVAIISDLRLSLNFIEGKEAIALSFFGGILYALAAYFYYKALFHKNDVSIVQILFNLTIIVLPVLSFIFFREILPVYKYAGMAVIFFGATLLSLGGRPDKKVSLKYFLIILGAVFFLSFSMLALGRAYDLLNFTGARQGFWLGFSFFILGGFISGISFGLLFRRNPLPLIKKYYTIFILGEVVNFFGNLFSQRALDISPSVSYVSAVETFSPVFIIAFSLLILFFFRRILARKNQAVERVYSGQIGDGRVKLLATVIMAVGACIIS